MNSIPDQASTYKQAVPHACPIPEITDAPCWLVWRAEPRGGKIAKVPYYCGGARRSGDLGSPGDLARLADYQTAAQAARRGGYTGVGVACDALPGVVALDLDHCLDASGAPATAEARWLVEQARAQRIYIEVSPSGTGLRALVRGALPDGRGGMSGGGIEMYSRGRYVTITGRAVVPGGIPEAQGIIAHLAECIDAARAAARRTPRVAQGGGKLRRVEANGLPRWVAEALAHIDPDCSYETWVSVGMALHAADPGEAGLAAWQAWGAGARQQDHAHRHHERTYTSRWRTFGARRGDAASITAGTLWHLAVEYGWTPPASRWPIEGEAREVPGLPLQEARERLGVEIAAALGRGGPTLIRASTGTGKTHASVQAVAEGVRGGASYLVAVHSRQQRDAWTDALIRAGVPAHDVHAWTGRARDTAWACPAADTAAEIGAARHFVAPSKCLRCQHGLARALVRAEDEIMRAPDRASVPQGRGRLSPVMRRDRAIDVLARQWGCGDDEAAQRARDLHAASPCTYLDQPDAAMQAAVIVADYRAVTPEMQSREGQARALILDDAPMSEDPDAVSHDDVHHWLARIDSDAAQTGGAMPDGIPEVRAALAAVASILGTGEGDYPEIDRAVLDAGLAAARRIAKREQIEVAEGIKWRQDGTIEDLPLRAILDLLCALETGTAAWGRTEQGAPVIIVAPPGVAQRAALDGRTALILDATAPEAVAEAVRRAGGRVIDLAVRQSARVLPTRGRTRTAAVRDPRKAAEDAAALLRGCEIGEDERPATVVVHQPVVEHVPAGGGLSVTWHGAPDTRGSDVHRGRDLLIVGAPLPGGESVYRQHCAESALLGERPIPRARFSSRARGQVVDLGDGRRQKCAVSLPADPRARDIEIEQVSRAVAQTVGRARAAETGARVVVATGYPLRLSGYGVAVEYAPEPRTTGPTGRQAADVARAVTRREAVERAIVRAKAAGRCSRRTIGCSGTTYSRWHRYLGLEPGARIAVEMLRRLRDQLIAAGAAWAERLRVDDQVADAMRAGHDPWSGGGWALAAWATAAESAEARRAWAAPPPAPARTG